jgi:hypothetical protein
VQRVQPLAAVGRKSGGFLDLFPGARHNARSMRHAETPRQAQRFTVDRHRAPMQLSRSTQGFLIVSVVAAFSVAVVLAVSLAGCASTRQTVGGWFGASTPTPTPRPTPQTKGAKASAPRIFYAGTEMKVYSEPAASSKVIGTLALHEKVTRTKLERGFAYVESATSSTKGWVTDAQLIRRLPEAPTTAAPAAAQPEPEAPVPAAEEPQAPEAPEEATPTTPPTAMPTSTPAPQKPKATPPGLGPSIFNPY